MRGNCEKNVEFNKGQVKYLMKRFALCWILSVYIFMMIPANAFAVNDPEWSQGKVDLSGRDFQREGSIPLNGEWEFYWNRLLNPSSFSNPGLPPESGWIHVPSQWGEEVLSNRGFGTYRLTVTLPPNSEKRTMALYVRSVATSYNLWVNGEMLASSGTVGTDRKTMVPRNVPQVVYFQPKAGNNELVIQVSNFVQRKGGIWESIRLGDATAVAHERNTHVISEIFIVGCLTVMGLYHIALFAFRRKDKAPLYFGILCLAISMRTLVLGETLGMAMLPQVPWEIGVKVEYISACFSFLMYVLFINTQYPSKMSRITNLVCSVVQGGVVSLVLLTPADIYTRIMLPYQLLVAIPTIIYTLSVYLWAAYKRKEGSVTNMIGFAIMAATITNDILFYNQVIMTGTWIPFGLLFFLLTQSVNVSARFSKAFYTAETLSEELKITNESLESKVLERTAALSDTNERLEETNRELTRSEQLRLELLANISHELNTPLTSIKGFASAMMDEVIQADYPKYAKRIHDRTLLLERVIEDLLELTQLETRQFHFQFEEHSAVPLLRWMFDRYDAEWMEDGGSRMIWEDDATGVADEREIVVSADSFRLEQVFSNLLSNARKYAGGDIRISIQLLMNTGSDSELRVMVFDSGPGIPDEDIPFIFERFYRGKYTGSKKREGSGLGLAICKEIMGYHNGQIGFTREDGKGHAFYFQLPARLRLSKSDNEGAVQAWKEES